MEKDLAEKARVEKIDGQSGSDDGFNGAPFELRRSVHGRTTWSEFGLGRGGDEPMRGQA